MAEHLLGTYNPLPVNIVKGQGSWVFDDEGNKYLDAFCGIAVTNLGHSHPAITEAICNQAKNLLHISNLVKIPAQNQLATKLCQLAKLNGKVFFNNSGAEAVETGIKLARLHGHAQKKELGKIIVMERAFHGRTMATLSASGSRKVHAGFEPLVQGFVRVPFNDLEAIENVAKNEPDIVAVLVEPIQGEGGIFPADDNYLKGIRDICDKNNWLMIVDEIQTGIARTGEFFAYQHYGIIPDAVLSAKALGNGVPIGACIINNSCADLFKPGSHGSTFGGNPLCSIAAQTTLEEIEKNDYATNAKERGAELFEALNRNLKGMPNVVEIRGKGLMIGIELDKPCRPILEIALKHNILFNIARDTIIRLLPPVNISAEETALIADKIPRIIREFYS